MDDTHFLARRRLLLATLAGAALLPSCAQGNTGEKTAALPLLEPGRAGMAPYLFLTVTSATRSVEELAHLVQSTLLPALAPADILHAYGPVAGAIQLWMALEPHMLDHYGMSVDAALSLLAGAVDGTVGPVPGRNTLDAWAIQRTHTRAEMNVNDVTLSLPGESHAPLFALGSSHYALAPAPWSSQACYSFMLEPRRRVVAPFEQHCQALLDAAANVIPEDLQIQMGRLGEFMKAVPTLYVSVKDDDS
jgi:hypothetical protein